MERVEALRALARSLDLEITSAVVGSERSIVEVRWFEEPVFYKSRSDCSHEEIKRGQGLHVSQRFDPVRKGWVDDACGDARLGTPLPSAHLRYDFDALTGAPIDKRVPKRLAARFAELCAAVDAAHGAAAAA